MSQRLQQPQRSLFTQYIGRNRTVISYIVLCNTAYVVHTYGRAAMLLRGNSVESTWMGQRDANDYEQRHMCCYVGYAQ